MQATYLLYARTGKEFEVADELAALGIDVWCGRAIEWKRLGKKRKPEPVERPALPNYLFAEMTPRQFYEAQSVKFLAGTMTPLTEQEVHGKPAWVDDVGRKHPARPGLYQFKADVDRAYERADKARRNSEVPRAEFKPGETVTIIGGPFADKIATFRRVVERAFDLHPRLRLDMDGLPLEVDPLDVRRSA